MQAQRRRSKTRSSNAIGFDNGDERRKFQNASINRTPRPGALAISFPKTKTIIPSVDEKNVFAKLSRWRTAPLEAARRAAAPFHLELAMR